MRAVTWVGCLALVVGSGCSFPEPTVVELVGDSSIADSAVTDGTSVDTRADGVADGTSEDAEEDVSDGGDDAAVDGGFSEAGDGGGDGGSAVDSRADVPDAVNCDKDNDLVLAKGGTCGGLDCDDNDPNAKPSVSTFLTLDATGKSHGGDWNCNGDVETQFATNVSCAGLLDGPSCLAKKGFTNNPTCGTSSNTYVECVFNGVTCGPGAARNETQGCK